MASTYDTYQKLAQQTSEQARNGGRPDPKLMADKAAAFNEVRKEERAAAAKGSLMRGGQVIATGGRTKASLQDEYVGKLSDKKLPASEANPKGQSPQEMARDRLK